MELHYFFYPESIVTAGTSWVGNNFSSVLLYGSLLEAYTYMKGEADVTATYKSRYDEAMLLLKQLGDGKDRQDSYRSGQVRYPVQ
jgi:nucleoside recognition membrane protein YjiH